MIRDLRIACIATLIIELTMFACGSAIAQQSIDSAPSTGSPGFEEMAYAYNKLAKGDLEGAIRFARRARRLAPAAEAPVRLLVDALAKAGNLQEALVVANDYVASHRPSATLLVQRASLRRRLGDFDGAMADLRRARKQGGLTKEQEAAAGDEIYEITLAPAYAALAAGKFSEAIEAAEKARQLDPKAEAPVRVLVDAHERLGQKAEALAQADRYISQYSPSGRLLAQRGYLRRSLMDLTGAAADFDAALAKPDIEPGQAEKLREARSEVERALNPPPGGSALAFEELDRAYKALAGGNLALAIKEAKEARAKDPKAEGPVLVLMTALQRSRRPRMALEEADRFAQENQPSVALLAQRGYIRRSLHDLSGAISDFKASLSSPGLQPNQEKNVRAALAEALRARVQPAARGGAGAQAGTSNLPAQPLDQAYDALRVQNFVEAVRAARRARAIDPKSEAPTLILMDALNRLGKYTEALAEADRFLRDNAPRAAVLAQRGFLRRQTKNVQGAISDFKEALSFGTLEPQESSRVSEALQEARYFMVADKAFKASAARNWQAALKYARMAQSFSRADEAIFRVTIEALAQLGRVDEALRESNALIARRTASGQAYAQRGFLREQTSDHSGAAADFSAALTRGRLQAGRRQEVKRALAVVNSKMAEAGGETAEALEELVRYSRENPRDAKIWSEMGRFFVRHSRHAEAVEAFENSLAIERSGEVLLSAAYASVYVDRSKESQYFRKALDRWSSDPSLNTRPEREREMVKAQVTEADQSIRTNVAFGNILGRRKRWGGYQFEPSFETAIRFDGRYLPFVTGFEGFIGGQWSQDQTRFTESYTRTGLRLRPFGGINFSVSGEFQHRFNPKPHNQFVLSWAYGYGGFTYTSAEGGAAASGALQESTTSYPFESGWRPLTSFATYGAYRAGERRYLHDALALLGYAYWSAAPVRAVIGPTAMAGVSYDSSDTRPFALGVGPALVFRSWVGGDEYRAFDGLITLQVGYLFPFGESRRQGGLRMRLGIIF